MSAKLSKSFESVEASIPGGATGRLAAQARLNPRLARLNALELNADMRPRWYHPLSMISWADAIWLIAKGELTGIPRINVIDYYPGVFIGAGSRKFQIPSVVSHRQMIPWPERVPLTRFNLLLRDNHTCQYTGIQMQTHELNFDHVIPKSQGGKTAWTNLVTCSKSINSLKANKTPKEAGLKLIRQPLEPSVFKMYDIGRRHPPNWLHESWADFLFWDAELTPRYTAVPEDEPKIILPEPEIE
jgi:5-methylcytosine-specific restriction endonuclease McrA